jgi:hypothetical protein
MGNRSINNDVSIDRYHPRISTIDRILSFKGGRVTISVENIYNILKPVMNVKKDWFLFEDSSSTDDNKLAIFCSSSFLNSSIALV